MEYQLKEYRIANRRNTKQLNLITLLVALENCNTLMINGLIEYLVNSSKSAFNHRARNVLSIIKNRNTLLS